MPVLIHTDPQSAKSLRDFPLRLLVEGSAPKAPLNTEFHSVATRSANAFDQDQLTAGHGLFLFQHPVLPPFSALDPHWPLPLKAPDVYKRQIRKSLTLIKLHQIRGKNITLKLLMRGFKPVSYTHLDVYKRQVPHKSLWPPKQS